MTTPGGLSWQGGWDEPGVLSVVIVESGLPGTGIFLYSGVPSASNPPVGWMTTATTDPFGTTITPGIFLAETAASGNAKGGLLWNTVVGSEPLIALYPDATVGFTGNSPFILGRVFNRGLVNELLAMAFGGGGTAGSSPVQLELFSQSKDGTALGHIAFYDWASANLICDINVNGIVAADPTTANILETWHTLTWSGAGVFTGTSRYRLMPYNAVRIEVVGSFASSGSPTASVLSAYNPAIQTQWPVFGAARCLITTGGGLTLFSVTGGSSVGFVQDVPLD